MELDDSDAPDKFDVTGRVARELAVDEVLGLLGLADAVEEQVDHLLPAPLALLLVDLAVVDPEAELARVPVLRCLSIETRYLSSRAASDRGVQLLELPPSLSCAR